MKIVEVEGPMVALRAYQVYARCAGLKLGRVVHQHLERALRTAISSGWLVFADEWGDGDFDHVIVRLPTMPATVLRSGGGRTLKEIPPSEIAHVLSMLRKSQPGLSREELFRKTLENFHLNRLTRGQMEILRNVEARMASLLSFPMQAWKKEDGGLSERRLPR
jgi:hypothetical protein